ncbi:hypothetical protein F2Q69_00052461 [Brassica cretica]|uniref:non-specific serine/threonine protein kinase n=1 Tax=Brassica cretica TaxID=69181 RepID=A0A8S9N8W5_BRACR|nr:hypothetical protein F2Q69_00052461 [Brassica cretica]
MSCSSSSGSEEDDEGFDSYRKGGYHAEGNQNGAATMNLIEKKLKRRARRAVAKISGRRVSIVGLSETPTKTVRSLDGIDMRCKVVDFGNACWADNKFAEEIQTRQYRAPEVILQSGYSFSVDMWSFACTAFELATGDMLFAPKDGNGYGEDEDHLALMMELLGKIPRKIATGGARSKDYFDRHGDLKRIRRLKYWPLDRLLTDKYKLPEAEAREFAEFLCPILAFEPEKRPTAQQCLQHPWLNLRAQNNEDQVEDSTRRDRLQIEPPFPPEFLIAAFNSGYLELSRPVETTPAATTPRRWGARPIEAFRGPRRRCGDCRDKPPPPANLDSPCLPTRTDKSETTKTRLLLQSGDSDLRSLLYHLAVL